MKDFLVETTTGRDISVTKTKTQNKKFQFSFFLHGAQEPPIYLSADERFSFGGGNLVEIFIIPKVFVSDPGLKAIEAEKRGCFFDGERQLKFFKSYSARKCQLECFSDASARLCGCVPFDLVRDQETRVCGSRESRCVGDLKYNLTNKYQTADCNCLQSCNEISYDFQIVTTRFAYK